MAVLLRAALAVLLVVTLAGGAAQPAFARGQRVAPVVQPVIDGITCNPEGEPGLAVTGSATVSGGLITSASLYAGEFQPITDPAYAPFAWNAMTLANWVSRDSWRRGVTTDSRTLVTGDADTWNSRNFATGLWARSDPDSWWIVDYTVQVGAARMSAQWTSARWYIHCADGSRVDAASLEEITYTEEAGLR